MFNKQYLPRNVNITFALIEFHRLCFLQDLPLNAKHRIYFAYLFVLFTSEKSPKSLHIDSERELARLNKVLKALVFSDNKISVI